MNGEGYPEAKRKLAHSLPAASNLRSTAPRLVKRICQSPCLRPNKADFPSATSVETAAAANATTALETEATASTTATTTAAITVHALPAIGPKEAAAAAPRA